MHPITMMALAAGLLAMTVNAAADDLDMEITPFGGYRFGGTFDVEESSASYEIAESSSYGLIADLRQSDSTQWEILYSRQQSEAEFSEAIAGDPLIDIDMQVLQLGGTYQGAGDTVRPFLAATIGGTHIEAGSNGSTSETFFSGSIGVGLQIRPGARLGLRIEARAYGTLISSSSELFCRTGPDQNICVALIDGKLLSQIETFAGIVFRF